MTAVIVAHDGAAWLPHVADALLGQTRPVQRVVAVDTGSRDRSGAVLASKFGQPAVFGMDRSTGYGAAIARALQHRAANVQVPRPAGGGPSGGQAGGQSGDRIEWLWLLHDDCEPAPDALEQLLRGTAETSAAAVLGPKLRDWSNREVILEAGLTLDTATRRITGIEPREVDQGQHDGDRDALAVSSAGMLVRRDVWEQVGGFDTAMGLFMDDIDFCWRVHSAGYRVRVITDAIVYHAQAATKYRRSISVGRRARMLDRRNGLLTLLGNLPFRQMMTTAASNVLVSLLRITFFLLAKRLAAAMDELTALTSVLCHPIRLITMRSARARGRRAAFSRVRADLPSGRSARRLVEFAMSAASKSQPDTAGAHHASADPTEDDSMLIDNGLGRRLLTSPSLLMFIALLAIALAATRSLLGAGPLGGGSLVPAWGGASDLWSTYLQSFHPAGIGSTAPAPSWLAVIAGLSTLLAGKPWLAVDVIMIGCVPLAGLTAMLAARKVTTSAAVRVWASVTYALLPVATGVIASGRFGSAVAFVLLPLIVAQAGRMVTESGPRAGRAAWATGLLVAIAGAFVPLLWLIVFVACVLTALVFRTTRRGMLRNLAIAALTAPVLLLPWTLTLLSHPAELFGEAGLPQPGTPVSGLPARALLMLSPGGPGLPPYWVTAGLAGVALAALFAGRRRRLITAGWGLALTGMLAAIVVSHLVVRPDDGGPVVVWAGLPLALAGLGLLLAAAAGADALGRLLAGVKGWRAILSGRGPWAALLALVGCSAPALAAVAWLSNGVSGPIHPVSNPVVPELVAVADGQARQVRTLVLTSSAGHISYLLLRGPSPALADAALTPPPDAERALGKVVSALITPSGGLAADQARLLADFDIGYILVQSPVDKQLATVLNDVSGLRPYSTTSGYSLWQLDTPPARVTVVEPDGTIVPIPSSPVGVSAAPVPAGGGTLMLSEPEGSWTASVDGQALAQVPSPAGSWAQAFKLPRGGGALTVGHPDLPHDLVLLFELLAFLVVAGLALPGIHVAEQDAQPAERAIADPAAGRRAGSYAGARVPAVARGSAGAAGSLGAGVAMDDATELAQLAGSAAVRTGLAAAGQAAPQRLARGARARAGRARSAAGGRIGRNKGRRGIPGGGRRGSDAARDDAATTSLAGTADPDRGSVRGRGSVPGRRTAGGRDGGQRGPADREGGLAGAPPYAGADDRRGDGRLAEAWPYAPADEFRASARGDGRLAEAWPYAAADEPSPGAVSRSGQRPYTSGADRDDGPPRRSRHSSPPGLAWPDAGEQDPGLSGHDDFSATGRSGRPYDEGAREPGGSHRAPAPGRSAAGRSPAGDWPYPGLDAGDPRDRYPADGRSPSGQSPAGAWPDADGDDVVSGSADDDRPDRYRPGRYQADQDRADRDRAERDRAGQDLVSGDWAGSTRSYKVNGPSSPSGLWPYEEPGWSRDSAAARPAADREAAAGPRDRDGYHGGERYGRQAAGRRALPGSDRGDQAWSGPGPAEADLTGAGRPADEWSGPGQPRDHQYRVDQYRGDQYRGDQPPDDRSRPEVSRGAQHSAGRGGTGRWGRRRREERPAGSSGRHRDERPVTEQPPAWSGDDDVLEPLPPLDDGRAHDRRSTWHAGDSGNWDRFGGGPDPQWSDPLPEFEPEYEGDSW